VDYVSRKVGKPLFFKYQGPLPPTHHITKLKRHIWIEITPVNVLEYGYSILAASHIDLDV